jgi:hypothetical protein
MLASRDIGRTRQIESPQRGDFFGEHLLELPSVTVFFKLENCDLYENTV